MQIVDIFGWDIRIERKATVWCLVTHRRGNKSAQGGAGGGDGVGGGGRYDAGISRGFYRVWRSNKLRATGRWRATGEP